jgi:hypothetical protein
LAYGDALIRLIRTRRSGTLLEQQNPDANASGFLGSLHVFTGVENLADQRWPETTLMAPLALARDRRKQLHREQHDWNEYFQPPSHDFPLGAVSVVSPATGLLNGQLGYRFDNGWRIQLDAFNILNSRSGQIYGSLLKSDSLYAMCFPSSGAPTAPIAVCQNGVMDRVLHPVGPLSIRLTLAGQF